MPKTRKSPNHTVRPPRSWKKRKTLYVLVFAATGLIVYELGRVAAERSEPLRSYTSTATIYQHAAPSAAEGSGQTAAPVPADSKRVEQQIISEADEPVRENLRVRAGQTDTPGELAVSISYTGQDPERPARLVNALAESYMADYRTKWKQHTHQAYMKAKLASDRAREELLRVRADLDAFAKRPAKPPQSPVVEADPPLVENPVWLDLDAELTQMRERRAELLVDRTPLHPAVKHAEIRIAELERQLAATPRELPGKRSELPAAELGPDDPTASTIAHAQTERDQTLRKLNQAVEQAEQTGRQAAQIEQTAWQDAQEEARISVELAWPCQVPPPPKPGIGLLLAALASGVVAAAGVAMISAATAIRPTIDSVKQAEAEVPVPIVGTVPDTPPTNEQEPARCP